MIRFLIIPCAISFAFSVAAQDGNWEVYLAQYEKGPGSTVVNMDIKKTGPDRTLPFLFSAGVNFTNCTADGLPVHDEFKNLNKISDSITALINRLVKNNLVGTFTYQCQRRDYFYVPDTTGLRQQITSLIGKHFPTYIPAFNIKADKEWEAYFDFLYPSELIMEYIKNEKVLIHLSEAGDKLDKPRQVDHWLYFKTNEDRNCFIRYATQHQFRVQSKEKINNEPYSFKLQLVRTDKVNISSISNITLELRREAKKCNGEYDGWETFVIK